MPHNFSQYDVFDEMNRLQEGEPSSHSVMHALLFEDVIIETDSLFAFGEREGQCTTQLVGFSYAPIWSEMGLYFEVHIFGVENSQVCFIMERLAVGGDASYFRMEVRETSRSISWDDTPFGGLPPFYETVSLLSYATNSRFAAPSSPPPPPMPFLPLFATDVQSLDTDCRRECYAGNRIVNIFCDSECATESLLETAILLFRYVDIGQMDAMEEKAYVRSKISACVAPLHPPRHVFTKEDVYDFLELRMLSLEESLC